jgi:hypothetical protein
MLNFLKAICLSITNKGPLGQKQPKEPKPKYRKPMPRVSEKRAAYKASPEGAAGRAHMGRVAQLPCLVCGAWPVEVHHEGTPRSDMRCLPLCPQHHRQEYGPGAYHYSKRAFYAEHGTSDELLARVERLLASNV